MTLLARRCRKAVLTRALLTSSCTSGKACQWRTTCPTLPTLAKTLATWMRSSTSTSKSSAAWCEISRDREHLVIQTQYVRFERNFTRSWLKVCSRLIRAKYSIIYRSIFFKYPLKATSAILISHSGCFCCVNLCYSNEQWYSKAQNLDIVMSSENRRATYYQQIRWRLVQFSVIIGSLKVLGPKTLWMLNLWSPSFSNWPLCGVVICISLPVYYL